MIGHRQILEARQNGQKPPTIFVEIGRPARPPKARSAGPHAGSLHEALYDPEAALDSGQFPVVYVDPGERPDLRFCVDCSVLLSGPRWSPDLLELGEAIAEAGARIVVVSATPDSDELLVHVGKAWVTA